MVENTNENKDFEVAVDSSLWRTRKIGRNTKMSPFLVARIVSSVLSLLGMAGGESNLDRLGFLAVESVRDFLIRRPALFQFSWNIRM